MILLITLLVVGPKRFPQIAREGGKYYRMARRYADAVMSDVRGAMADLEKEIGEPGEELRSIREIGRDLTTGIGETTHEIRRIGAETQDAASGAPPIEPTDSTAKPENPQKPEA